MKHHRHSAAEIAAKLADAEALSAEGKNQDEIARALGVSVMTFHRWRKANHSGRSQIKDGANHSNSSKINPISSLELENSRLRRLVTDLLLEKLTVAEAHSKKAS